MTDWFKVSLLAFFVIVFVFSQSGSQEPGIRSGVLLRTWRIQEISEGTSPAKTSVLGVQSPEL